MSSPATPAAVFGPSVAAWFVLAGIGLAAGVPVSEAAVCGIVLAVLVHTAAALPRDPELAAWPARRLALAAAGVLVGWVLHSWLLIAIGWMHFARAATTRHWSESQRAVVRPWWPVAVMAVPWVWADAWWLGWQMRLTAASVAGSLLMPFFEGLQQQGTSLVVSGVRVDVAESCAGLGLLQATLTLGLAAAAYVTRSTLRVLVAVPLLVLAAWTVNVVRVGALTLVAVLGSPELASSTLHDLIGYGLLALMAWVGWLAFDRAVLPGRAAEAATS